MIDINYDGKIYHVKSKNSEININELEKIYNIYTTTSEFFESSICMFDILGLPRHISEELDANEIVDIRKNLELDIIPGDYTTELLINGVKYVCRLNEQGIPRITGKVFKYIENACKKDFYIADILSILFKVEDIDDVIHYDTISERADLFRESVTADVAIPFIVLISEKYIKNIEGLNELKK
jgi:hypothetical protein